MTECEMCGCTDSGASEMACIEIPSGEPCHWIRPGLCSACDELGGPGLAIRSWPLSEPGEALSDTLDACFTGLERLEEA